MTCWRNSTCRRDRTTAAIVQSRKALDSDPKDQTALYHLIQALRKSGRTKDIPELLKRLADLRIEGTKEEAEHNRYKLVEDKSPSMEKPAALTITRRDFVRLSLGSAACMAARRDS